MQDVNRKRIVRHFAFNSKYHNTINMSMIHAIFNGLLTVSALRNAI